MAFETPDMGAEQEQQFASQEEAEKALQMAVEADDAKKAESALKAMEILQKAKREKLPEELLDAMKDATNPEQVNFQRLGTAEDILNNFSSPESREAEGYEKVSVGGKEIMLSRKTSIPITYTEALEWCKADGGRLPTIEELEALYNSDKAESFDGKVLWSSSMKLNSPQVFDFAHGRKEIRNREDEINATRAVGDIH